MAVAVIVASEGATISKPPDSLGWAVVTEKDGISEGHSALHSAQGVDAMGFTHGMGPWVWQVLPRLVFLV